jgi:hypothetical protein
VQLTERRRQLLSGGSTAYSTAQCATNHGTAQHSTAQHSTLPHLLFEVVQAVPVVFLHLILILHDVVRVGLGVAGNTNAEVVSVLRPAPRGDG